MWTCLPLHRCRKPSVPRKQAYQGVLQMVKETALYGELLGLP